MKICPPCQGILDLSDFKFRIPILSDFGSHDKVDLAVWFYDLFVLGKDDFAGFKTQPIGIGCLGLSGMYLPPR